jgi:hypothetical protein
MHCTLRVQYFFDSSEFRSQNRLEQIIEHDERSYIVTQEHFARVDPKSAGLRVKPITLQKDTKED